MLKGVNKNENNKEILNNIPKHKWIDQYKALWYNDDVKEGPSHIEIKNFITYELSLIHI